MKVILGWEYVSLMDLWWCKCENVKRCVVGIFCEGGVFMLIINFCFYVLMLISFMILIIIYFI